MTDVLPTGLVETNSPDNETFLETVFRGMPEGVKPVVINIPGNPNEAPRSAWIGGPWQSDKTPNSDNTYFSLAVYAPQPNGSIRRKKAAFKGLYSIVLDDVGTKVATEAVTLAPSWKLETSKGNYQVGYLLKEPITDTRQADTLMAAIIFAKLCDAGANGPTARLVRLPVGINGKYEPAFPCRMQTWEPERRFTPEEIIEAYKLDLNSQTPKAKKKSTSKPSQQRDEVFQPAPTDNPVIAALKVRKLYKRTLDGNKHDITCPWCQEHTDAADDGAAYFEPSQNYPVGGFKCQHSHGDVMSIYTLLEFLGVSVSAARMKASIRVTPGQLHQIVPYAEKALADTGRYFHNGLGVVMVSKEPVSGEMRLRPMTAQSLPPALSAAAAWERIDGRSLNIMAIDPPEKVTTALAGAAEYKYLPYLLGVAHQPYLRGNGDLVLTPGYDAESYLFGDFEASDYLIPVEPTREEAEASLARLCGLLDEFPFATPYDLSAALSAMLTAVLRAALPLAPMYHVQAPQISSGKSFLCSLIAALASAKSGTTTNLPREEEECQKVLLAELMRGTPAIIFDNLTGDIIPHKSLCSVLTEERVSWRILGVSKTAEVSTRVLFLSSGNNVIPLRDMTRRCVTITLNPQCETPMARTFRRPNLLNEVLADRASYVADGLTIVRAWICAGRPITECRTVASYGAWSELCRQPLLWLGQPDPAQPLFETLENDPDKANLGLLLNCWWELFGAKPTRVRKVLDTVNDDFDDLGATPATPEATSSNALRELLQEIAGDGRGLIDPKNLGWWLKRHANRIVGDKRLKKAEGIRAAVAWQVELVK
jgi:hypothetical protein